MSNFRKLLALLALLAATMVGTAGTVATVVDDGAANGLQRTTAVSVDRSGTGANGLANGLGANGL